MGIEHTDIKVCTLLAVILEVLCFYVQSFGQLKACAAENTSPMGSARATSAASNHISIKHVSKGLFVQLEIILCH